MKALLLGLLLVLAPCIIAHVCIQDQVFDINALMSTPQNYTASYPTDSNTQPIRLRIDESYLSTDELGMTCTYAGQVIQAVADSSSTQTQAYTCQGSDVVSSNLRGYLERLLTSAQTLWQGSLKVIPVQGLLALRGSSSPQGLYGGVYLSSEYTNGIPNTDMVIFVTARPIIQDGGGTTETLAVATVVQEDQVGRPVFGHLNINPAGIDISTAMYNQNFGVVVHEMTHALGFNIQKFQNINPLPGQPSDITSTVTLNVGAGNEADVRTIIGSPKVKAWAQRYYGCPTVLGVELENQGGSGTALSHWEKRTTMNEYMTGTASRNPVFSELTLSLLEDTGWYKANFSLAGQLLWGQGMGCAFTNQGCNNWPSDYNGYFCTNNGKDGCTSDYQAKGECQISTATGVPTMYQYFSDPTQVGSYDLPDYCPLTWGYSNGWCFDPGAATKSIFNMGETFSPNSRCFTSSLAKDLLIAGTQTNACYETFCTGPNELRVKIGGYYYLCPAGANIKIIDFGGTVSCPKRIEQICGTVNGTIGGSSSGKYPGADPLWPVITSISPNKGGIGLRVNITGKNFLPGSQVIVGDPLEDIVIVSSTLITGVIPSSDRFKNPTNIIEQKVSIIVVDPKGRSTVDYDVFTIKVKINKTFFKNAGEYLKDNWYVTLAIAVAIVLTCLCCGYCCYRQKGKAREAGTERY